VEPEEKHLKLLHRSRITQRTESLEDQFYFHTVAARSAREYVRELDELCGLKPEKNPSWRKL
jgi:hypothetical protein